MLEPTQIISIALIVIAVSLACSILALILKKRKMALLSLSVYFITGLLFFGLRAYLKNFFPFTDKVESFTTLSVLIAACAFYYRNRVSNKELILFLTFALASICTVFLFTDVIRYPSAYLLTIWYPLHVPLSFGAYAFWILAGITVIFTKQTLPEEELTLSATHLNRIGFLLFTLSMFFGGIWGYLAWGAYFLWDPKLLWSVILWLYYCNLLHIDSLPRFKKIKAPLYLLGIVLILITFIGTGFFSRSIHKF